MPLRDYAHHNEDAAWMWYQEEGRHHDEPSDPDDFYDRDDDRDVDPLWTIDCEVCEYAHDVFSEDENFSCSNCGALLDPHGAVVVTQPELSLED